MPYKDKTNQKKYQENYYKKKCDNSKPIIQTIQTQELLYFITWNYKIKHVNEEINILKNPKPRKNNFIHWRLKIEKINTQFNRRCELPRWLYNIKICHKEIQTRQTRLFKPVKPLKNQ